MCKKKVYLIQIGYLQENEAFFPYAAGTLMAFAKSQKELCKAYEFEDIIFIREDVDTVMQQISQPFIVGLSCYVWNFEYNKRLAAQIKEKYPECYIVFGGHHVAADSNLMTECRFIDFLIHSEGEEVFSLLLAALNASTSLLSIPNISFRNENGIVNTPFKCMEECNYPSPYLSGCFDRILEKYSDIKFNLLIETNRGCPYGCTYCDWGRLKQPVKLFPIERTIKELDWAVDHGIDFIAVADANFGIFERDAVITEYVVEQHNKTGRFNAFQVSYAKGNSERVYRIAKMLNACGINKGTTLSFQSLTPAVMKNIGRANISMSDYTKIIERYNRDGISTYSELILGLPGETYESFVSGIDMLLNAGQHYCIYIHNCELLPCSPMADSLYIKKFDIRTSRIPLNQPHRDVMDNDEITEMSSIITQTSTMDSVDWVKMNLYSCVIQCFHFGGLLRLIAIYLHYTQNLKYSDFYFSFIDYVLNNDCGKCSVVVRKVKEKLKGVIHEKGSMTFFDKSLGCNTWSADEFMQLSILKDADSFYKCINPFLETWESSEMFRQLIRFQIKMLKRPDTEDFEFQSSYDFLEWFQSVFNEGTNKDVIKQDTQYYVKANRYTFPEFAKYIVWYGKKTQDKTYLNQTKKRYF